MNIKTPVRFKTEREIVRQCWKQKVPYELGLIIIRVGYGDGVAWYDPISGHFWGRCRGFDKRVITFSSRERRHDKQRWMQALRAFFHEEIKR